MSLILNIDTTAGTAFVNIARDGIVIIEASNTSQKDHAAFLQPAIALLINEAKVALKDFSAIAVNHGPGSYTGIRVGMASAKGLCFALQKPLITVNALEVMAHDVISHTAAAGAFELFCPMIDARRMEVYTAAYDIELNVIMPPAAIILRSDSFKGLLPDDKTVFFGSGAHKLQQLVGYKPTQFVEGNSLGNSMAILSFNKLQNFDITVLAYAEPLYIKEFHTITNV